MMSKKKSIILGVSINHTTTGVFFKHFMHFYLFNKDKYDLYPIIETHYETCEARNKIIDKALSFYNKPDYIFFIDADMIYEPTILDKLIKAGKDIITGLYFQKTYPYYPLAWTTINKKYAWFSTFKANEIQEISNCGAGALLVKTSVFEKIPFPWFKFVYNKNNNPVGEDIYFCRKAQKFGFKIWLHGGTMIDHVGGVVGKRLFDGVCERKDIDHLRTTGLESNNFSVK